MTLLINIREQIVPVTLEAVILTIGYFLHMSYDPQSFSSPGSDDVSDLQLSGHDLIDTR